MKSSRSMKALIIAIACVLFPLNIVAQSLPVPPARVYGRAEVVSKTGIVATSQVLASQAGAQMLARGGSAVDAAIAANAVLSVLEPMMAGPGGDLFAIYRDAKTGKTSGLNASGWAPSGLTIDLLKQKGIERMPARGIFSVTVPGCVDGWEKLHRRFGRLPWKELFDPAIYLADNGFPISDNIALVWKLGFAASFTDEECQRVFGTAVPQAGDFLNNPELAAALRLIAERFSSNGPPPGAHGGVSESCGMGTGGRFRQHNRHEVWGVRSARRWRRDPGTTSEIKPIRGTSSCQLSGDPLFGNNPEVMSGLGSPRTPIL